MKLGEQQSRSKRFLIKGNISSVAYTAYQTMEISTAFITLKVKVKVKVKVKFSLEQDMKAQMALNGRGWSAQRPGRFTSWKRPGTHCTGGWVGPRAGLDGCGKSRPHQDSIPGPSSP
jgi:hypothetical protein